MKVTSTWPYLPRTALGRASSAEQQVDVFREPGVAMVSDGVAADKHVLNPVLFE